MSLLTPENGFRKTMKSRMLEIADAIAPWFQENGSWENAAFASAIKKITLEDDTEFTFAVSGGTKADGSYSFSISVEEAVNPTGRRLFFGVQYRKSDLNFHTTYDPPMGMPGSSWRKFIDAGVAMKDGMGGESPFDDTEVVPHEDVAVRIYSLQSGQYYAADVGAGVSPTIWEEETETTFPNSDFEYIYNHNMVDIDEEGVITALVPGISNITAYRKDDPVRSYFSFFFEAYAEGQYVITDTDIKLLSRGPLGKINFHPTPVSYNDFTFDYAPDEDINVATVGSDGTIIPARPGTTTFVVTCNQANGESYEVGTVTVTVAENPGLTYTLNHSKLVMHPGEQIQLSVTPVPYGGVEWAVIGTDAVEVDENGLVTANQWGEADVQAGFAEGPLRIRATVLTNNTPGMVAAWPEGQYGKVKAGQMVEIVIEGVAGGTDFEVRSSDDTIAEYVAGEGYYIKGNKPGRVSFTVSSEGVSSTPYKVEVIHPDYEIADEEIVLTVGGKTKVNVTPTPFPGASLQWSVDNAEIATIDTAGYMRGIQAAPVTVTLTSGDNVSSQEVVVTVPDAEYTMEPAEITVWTDAPRSLVIDPPVQETDEVSYFTSDENIATFANRTVTGHNQGYATLYANINGNEVSSEVIVKQKYHGLEASDSTPRVGQTVEFEIVPEPVELGPVTWSVTPHTRATIDTDGVLTCIKKGPVVVRATFDERSAALSMKIGKALPSYHIVPANATVDIGQRIDYTIPGLPEGAEVAWWSETEQGSVDDQNLGTFIGAGEGMVTIVAEVTIDGESIRLDTILNVTDVISDEINILPLHPNVTFGGTAYFGCTNNNVEVDSYTSSNPHVLISNDAVTFWDVGTFTITMHGTLDGEPVTGTSTFTVLPSGNEYDLEFDEYTVPDEDDIHIGSKVVFILDPSVPPLSNVGVSVSPEGAINWTDPLTGFIEASGPVTVTVTVDGTTNVKQFNVSEEPLVYEIAADDYYPLGTETTMEVWPEIPPGTSLNWSISPNDGSIATLGGEGLFTTTGLGTVTVTATFGEHTIHKDIEVRVPNFEGQIVGPDLSTAIVIIKGNTDRIVLNPEYTYPMNLGNQNPELISVDPVDGRTDQWDVTGLEEGMAGVYADYAGDYSSNGYINVVALRDMYDVPLTNTMELGYGLAQQIKWDAWRIPGGATTQITIADPDIVTLSGANTLIGNGEGTTTVTVRLGASTFDVEVTVGPPHTVEGGPDFLAFVDQTLEFTISDGWDGAVSPGSSLQIYPEKATFTNTSTGLPDKATLTFHEEADAELVIQLGSGEVISDMHVWGLTVRDGANAIVGSTYDMAISDTTVLSISGSYPNTFTPTIVSDNPSVASFNSGTDTLTAVAPGTATITVTIGTAVQEIEVTVAPA